MLNHLKIGRKTLTYNFIHHHACCDAYIERTDMTEHRDCGTGIGLRENFSRYADVFGTHDDCDRSGKIGKRVIL